MNTKDLNGKWKLYPVFCGAEINTPELLLKSGIKPIKATVPGNVELDLINAGLLPQDIFKGMNICLAEKYELYDWWYETEFENIFDRDRIFLEFEGVDTIAEYWLNDKLIGTSQNMLIGHSIDVSDTVVIGKNILYVHIKSSRILANSISYDIHNIYSHPQPNCDGIALRKAPHSVGWDIMPRAVSAGIWKRVQLVNQEEFEISQLYYSTIRIDKNTATLRFCWELEMPDDIDDVYIKITGMCGDSNFEIYEKVYFKMGKAEVSVKNPKLWWPYGYGEANLYNTKATVICKDNPKAEKCLKIGIRTVHLERTETTDGINGKFCFYVNGTPIMCKGSNWVPLDVYHSRDYERLGRAMELVSDIGCNILRCWGGNVYESDDFYDYCDENGIMVWQDFSMACAGYHQHREFYEVIEKEVTAVVRRLRNHSSIIIWAGDNECDAVMSEFGANPMMNRITREIIPLCLYNNDPSRPYLPSSPCFSDETWRENRIEVLSEYHLWGIRDYYKSDYYAKSKAHFVSETGYHGCPSIDSLQKFINEDNLWPTDNEEWNLHSSDQRNNNARVRLIHTQIDEMFAFKPENLEEFAMASQFSQAEAKKYFIERVRCDKPIKTGIIWWNLLDGWPQISDAVVDYYFNKKVAYEYIKSSQQPFCIMMKSVDNSESELVAVNDTLKIKKGEYKVRNGITGEEESAGEFHVSENGQAILDKIPVMYSEKKLFLIEWKIDGRVYYNHYISGYPPIDFEWYKKCYEIIRPLYQDN